MGSDQRLVIIGQAPSSDASARLMRKRPSLILAGRSGRKLAKLGGVSFSSYLSGAERVNLLSSYPGKNGKGDHFPAYLVTRRAQQLRDKLRGRTVLLLGSGVAKSFNVEVEPRLRWRTLKSSGIVFATVPHPSGVNRWWNKERNMKRAELFLRRAFKRIRREAAQ